MASLLPQPTLAALEERLIRLERNLLTNLRWSIDIMATQQDAADRLNAVAVILDKIGSETTALLAEVETLKQAVADAGNVTPPLQAALDAVETRVHNVDELVPDQVAPPPAE